MTKEAALTSFFESFGITAYPETDVPSDAVYPRLTYQVVIGEPNQETALTCNLWWYSESHIAINAKAEEVRQRLGRGGVLLPCDGGAIWLKRGQPFAQDVKDENDMVRRKYIVLTVEYIIVD